MSIASFVASGLSASTSIGYAVNPRPISSLDPDHGVTFVTEQNVISPILEILDAVEKGEDFGEPEKPRQKRQDDKRPVNIFGLGFGTAPRPLPLPVPGGHGQGLIGEQTATDNEHRQNIQRPVSNEAANFGVKDFAKLAGIKS